MWSGAINDYKWELVKWDTMCTPKKQGGLGLRYPEVANLVGGAKLWWRWATHSQDPWAKIWHIKYVENWDKQDLIIFLEDLPGSHIWKTACRGRSIVQDHSFSEIRNGQTKMIWEDSWKKMPPLGCDARICQFIEECTNQVIMKFEDQWMDEEVDQHFRVWPIQDWWDQWGLIEEVDRMEEALVNKNTIETQIGLQNIGYFFNKGILSII